MSDLPQQETIFQYVANGTEDEYVFACYVPEDFDLDVYVTASGETPVPADDIQVLDVDYTVTMNLDPITGGFITFLPGHIPASGSIVTLNRNVRDSLNVEFSDGRNFNGANLDTALDRLLLLCQQNKNYALDRNLSYRINSYLPSIQENTQVEPLEPGYIWIGATGGGVMTALLEENPDVSTLRSELANNSPGTDGARLVGYYDASSGGLGATTVEAFLANLNNYINTNFPQQFLTSGMMIDYAGTSAPTGFLLCDGSAVSRATYANLFTAIGTTWGVGDGSTTFNVPDFRRRVAVGSGGSGSGTLGNATGNTGGEETHTMLEAELAAHVHAFGNPGNQFIGTGTGGNSYGGATFTSGVNPNTASTGSSTPFNVMQPSAVVTKIIKT